MSFVDFQLSEEVASVLAEQDFTSPTKVQLAVIPKLLANQDVLAESPTGSGKTLAYALPILQKIIPNLRLPQALILCPTRELCDQVLREIKRFSKKLPMIKSVSLVGGKPHDQQIAAISDGAQIIVGTPGRTLDLLTSGHLPVSDLKILVIDEADRMLDEGFSEEMSLIFAKLPRHRQTALFSATINDEVKSLSQLLQKDPAEVSIKAQADQLPDIQQYLYLCEQDQKLETLIRVLQQHPSQCCVVFCRTKLSVSQISLALQKLKVSCGELHGDLDQTQRDQVLATFRNLSLRILVATDVAARGIDIDQLDLVINYDLPPTAETYVHRIGRTGRAGRKGVAVSLAVLAESFKVLEIESTTKSQLIRQPLGFKNQLGFGPEFQSTVMKTIFIAGGKKDKLRPGDILGALTATPNSLSSDQIGKIDLYPNHSLVAVKSEVASIALEKLRSGRIKGARFKAYKL